MTTKKYIKRIKGWRGEGKHQKRKALLKDQKRHAIKYGYLRGRPS